ncbi:hypothetical protein [Flavobacterium sp. HJSW_4]|uniref:hypothetical protein n=1 Tax=Flavobacterium sp. HJSW_4 TaxID=3344660 RepID=UPI0035F4ECCE
MEKTITMKVRKDPAPKEQRSLLKLKGSLISKGYTQIIHIEDLDEVFHLNTFEIPEQMGDEVRQYIAAFIASQELSQTITITN